VALTPNSQEGQHQKHQMGSALPDIGRATTTMCLRIADTAPTAAANDVARRCVGHRDAWQRRCDTGNAGLVWNDPAAWPLDHDVAVIAVSNITKRIRHMGAFPSNRLTKSQATKRFLD
jgi:hypothetical protein